MNNEKITHELEALRNAVSYFNLHKYTVRHVPVLDNRSKKREYVFCEPPVNGSCHGITGRLSYENMNHFIFGFGRATQMNFEALAASRDLPRSVNLHKVQQA
jgi:hypothetical protein